MTFEDWLAEVADLVHMDPEELRDYSSQIPLLYNARMSPNEAADFIRMGA